MPQSVKDALADAETLRAVVRQSGASLSELWLHPLFRASVTGFRCAKLIRRRWSNRAYAEAVAGAHAAFRAVPALREVQ